MVVCATLLMPPLFQEGVTVNPGQERCPVNSSDGVARPTTTLSAKFITFGDDIAGIVRIPSKCSVDLHRRAMDIVTQM